MTAPAWYCPQCGGDNSCCDCEAARERCLAMLAKAQSPEDLLEAMTVFIDGQEPGETLSHG